MKALFGLGALVGFVLALPVGLVLVAVVMVVGVVHFAAGLLHGLSCLIRHHATQPALDWFEALPERTRVWLARRFGE